MSRDACEYQRELGVRRLAHLNTTKPTRTTSGDKSKLSSTSVPMLSSVFANSSALNVEASSATITSNSSSITAQSRAAASPDGSVAVGGDVERAGGHNAAFVDKRCSSGTAAQMPSASAPNAFGSTARQFLNVKIRASLPAPTIRAFSSSIIGVDSPTETTKMFARLCSRSASADGAISSLKCARESCEFNPGARARASTHSAAPFLITITTRGALDELESANSLTASRSASPSRGAPLRRRSLPSRVSISAAAL